MSILLPCPLKKKKYIYIYIYNILLLLLLLLLFIFILFIIIFILYIYIYNIYIFIYLFSCTRFLIFLRHMGSLVVTCELSVAAYGIYFLSRDRIWAPCFGSTVVLATGLPGKSHPCPLFNGLFVPAIILYMFSAHIDGPSHPWSFSPLTPLYL